MGRRVGITERRLVLWKFELWADGVKDAGCVHAAKSKFPMLEADIVMAIVDAGEGCNKKSSTDMVLADIRKRFLLFEQNAELPDRHRNRVKNHKTMPVRY